MQLEQSARHAYLEATRLFRRGLLSCKAYVLAFEAMEQERLVFIDTVKKVG